MLNQGGSDSLAEDNAKRIAHPQDSCRHRPLSVREPMLRQNIFQDEIFFEHKIFYADG